MKIGYQEQLFIIVIGILLLFTGIWALGSRKGLYVFGSISMIVIVLVAIQYFSRGKEVALKLLTNEKVLYEEEGVKVNLQRINRSELAPDCKVSLTNLRIIIGKRRLFGTQYQESFHFYFTERNEELPSAISLTAVSSSMSLKDVVAKSRKKDKSFVYFVPKLNVTSIKNVEMHLKGVDQFMAQLKQ